MPNDTVITLTTDFGASSPYVGAMKGAILSINRHATIVDITHSIAPQDIFAASQVLSDVTPYFPSDAIHVVVVDPGVGTDRSIVYAEFDFGRYVCPDNGLLSRLAEQQTPSMIVAVTAREFFRGSVSSTFHGRDIMAPVAAHLSLGICPTRLGPPHQSLTRTVWPGANKVAQNITGEIVSIDSFGNLITNISRDMLADVPTDDTVLIHCDGHETRGIFDTYGDQPAMTLMSLIGSNDHLEIAIVEDSAKIMLGVAVGTPVEITW